MSQKLLWAEQTINNTFKIMNNSLAATFSLFSILLFVGCSKQGPARDIFEQGRQKYDKQDWNGAVADFTLALTFETNFSIYANRALAESHLNRLDEAISDYHRAIKLEPTDSTLYINCAVLEGKQDNFDAGIADYSKAIEVNPNDDLAYFDRGIAKRIKGDWDESIADFSKAIELNPKYAQSYNERGWTEFLQHNNDAAIADATQSIQLSPTNCYAYGTRGWARYGNGDVSGAVEDCKKAINLSMPNSLEAYSDQGMLDFINGDYEKAIAAWEKVVVQDASLKQEFQPWIENAQIKLQSKKQ